MKFIKILALIILSIDVFGQNATLTFNITDVCGNPTNNQILTQLYWLNGTSTVFLSETTDQPAVFNQLAASGKYEVKIKNINSDPSYDFTIKDVVLAQYHIIGLKRIDEANLLAADFNKDGKVTASDLTEMKKILLKIKSNDDYESYFYTDEMLNVTTLQNNNFLIDGITGGNQTINIKNIKRGHIAKSNTDYCNGGCLDITDRINNLLFENVKIEKDKELTFSVFTNPSNNYVAIDFSMAIINAQVIDVTSPSGSGFNLIGPNEWNIQWMTAGILPAYGLRDKVISFKVKPDIDGKLSDIFSSLNLNNKNVSIEKIGDCIVAVKNLSIVAENEIYDNCIIKWPDNITIPICDMTYYAGKPTTDIVCENNFNFTYTDAEVAPCQKTIRTWTALNWSKGTIETHFQIIRIDQDFKHVCFQNVEINLNGGFKFVAARSLVKTAYADHFYSFSDNDISDSIILLKYESPLKFYLKIFDLTDTTFCFSNITKSDIDPVSFTIKDFIEVPYINGYQVAAISFLKNGPLLPFGVTEFEISYNNGAYAGILDFDENYADQETIINLRYKLNGLIVNYGNVKVKFLPKIDIPPLRLYVYNDYLTYGQSYKVVFYSSNFNDVSSLQFGMTIDDCSLLEVNNNQLEIFNSYVYNPINNTIRLLWFDQTGKSKTIAPEIALFTFVISPGKSGYLKDFIKIDPLVMDLEATFNSSTIPTQILLDIEFVNRNSNVADDGHFDTNYLIYPNPGTGNIINIQIPESIKLSNIDIFERNGRLIEKFSTFRYTDASHVELYLNDDIIQGVYLIRIQSQKASISKKWIKL